MSLSSLLLRAPAASDDEEKVIDKELDALFRSNPVAVFHKPATEISVPIPGSSTKESTKKRKLTTETATDSRPKRSKPEKDVSEKPRVRISEKVEEIQPPAKEDVQSPKARKADRKKGGKGKSKAVVEEPEDGEDNSELENAYLDGKTVAKDVTSKDEPDDSDDSDEPAPLVHETLQKNKKGSRSGPKAKFVPADETPELRDARTIFVGNLSVEVAQKKSSLKQLQRHILAQVPSAKIESTRFRSIPFQNPTSKLPTSDDERDSPKKPKPKPKPESSSTKQARPHDRERTSNWRDHRKDDDDGGKSNEKIFLNPKQKKRIAFINQEFHSTADTVNAYIVFAHPLPAEARPSNLPPPPPTMDPYEAARLSAEKCDGTVFMDRMIRVDYLSKRDPIDKVGEAHGAMDGDPKLSVFIGNLDFASKEEDLRVFLEGVVSAERGPPGEDTTGESASQKPKTWVTRVRIVRDKETQLGKGFAYVQFSDRECVDEVLALEATKLRFAKRTLRAQRCKTAPGSSSSTRQSTSNVNKPAQTNHPSSRPGSAPIVVPKGDPSLGEKLAHLPKDARKQYKSSDADRVARRLAKKKARMALGNEGVKVQGKERERVRKVPTLNKGAPPRKESKGRVRSEKSLAKRNMKK